MRLRCVRPLGVALLCMVLAACAGTGNDQGARNPDLITGDEVERSSQSNAYELIRSRRPTWLNRRGVQSINVPGDIAVYLDGTRLGGAGALRQIPIDWVRSIRHFDAALATQRWGTGHAYGAIQVEGR